MFNYPTKLILKKTRYSAAKGWRFNILWAGQTVKNDLIRPKHIDLLKSDPLEQNSPQSFVWLNGRDDKGKLRNMRKYLFKYGQSGVSFHPTGIKHLTQTIAASSIFLELGLEHKAPT